MSKWLKAEELPEDIEKAVGETIAPEKANPEGEAVLREFRQEMTPTELMHSAIMTMLIAGESDERVLAEFIGDNALSNNQQARVRTLWPQIASQVDQVWAQIAKAAEELTKQE